MFYKTWMKIVKNLLRSHGNLVNETDHRKLWQLLSIICCNARDMTNSDKSAPPRQHSIQHISDALCLVWLTHRSAQAFENRRIYLAIIGN